MMEGNRLFPVFLKLKDLKLLLVGGGNVGLEKLEALAGNEPDLQVKVVADRILPEVVALTAEHPGIQLVRRQFQPEDLEGIDLEFLATDNPELHARIRKLARERKLLLNVADTPPLCDFYLGSIVKKGDLKIAISTNGKSPTLAKRIREYLQETIPESGVQQLMDQLVSIRGKLKNDFQYKVKKLNEITAAWSETGSKDK
jgi:siroheme synthase-like protein